MSVQPVQHRRMRILAVILTLLWAAIAIAVASAYRPGGPVDIAIALVSFLPVLVADAGVVWPPLANTHRGRVALVWVWIAAVLLAVPVLYGIAWTLAIGGPQSLVPSLEAAYGGALALFAMSFFSVIGLVHYRRGVPLLERRATWLSGGLAVLLAAIAGLGFVFVALVNDQALREEEMPSSRFGPTDPDLVPPFCDEPIDLGPNAIITIEASSSLDNEDRGFARLEGRRNGQDESWGGSWEGPDGAGQQAYLRLGSRAWLNDDSDDPGAPGTTWHETRPDPFGLIGRTPLTMDGPPHAIADQPRGSIVAEDLGLDFIEGARARHCRTFMSGPTALDTFLPLRWLLYDASVAPEGAIERWRGEMDWWVFGDGELGVASVEVSGSRAETVWDAEGVRAVIQARLEALHRDRPVDVTAPVTLAPTPSPAPTLGAKSSPVPSAEPDTAVPSATP